MNSWKMQSIFKLTGRPYSVIVTKPNDKAKKREVTLRFRIEEDVVDQLCQNQKNEKPKCIGGMAISVTPKGLDFCIVFLSIKDTY